jgi:hypothetical protein
VSSSSRTVLKGLCRNFSLHSGHFLGRCHPCSLQLICLPIGIVKELLQCSHDALFGANSFLQSSQNFGGCSQSVCARMFVPQSSYDASYHLASFSALHSLQKRSHIKTGSEHASGVRQANDVKSTLKHCSNGPLFARIVHITLR